MWKYGKLRIAMITTTIGRQVSKHVGLQGKKCTKYCKISLDTAGHSKKIIEKIGRRLLSFCMEKNSSE